MRTGKSTLTHMLQLFDDGAFRQMAVLSWGRGHMPPPRFVLAPTFVASCYLCNMKTINEQDSATIY